MAKAKTKAKVEPETEEPVAVEEPEELPPEAVVEAGPPGVVGAGPGRKPLGAKEIIPFKWKLIGKSSGLFVTLFKAVEQEEVQAQFDRLQREGYYTELQIVDVNAKVEQSKLAMKTALGKPKDPPFMEAPKPAMKKKTPPTKPDAPVEPPSKPKPVAKAPTKAAPPKKAPPTKPAAKKTVKKK